MISTGIVIEAVTGTDTGPEGVPSRSRTLPGRFREADR
jgi:hypothetical protein